MKKYKYTGTAPEVEIPLVGKVKKGEIITTSIEINNAEFEEIKEVPQIAKKEESK
jgi:hypothetical protein